MILGLLARFTPVHVARTAEEREAIYRFRYSIYGREMRRSYAGVDHEKGRLAEPEDERPESRLYYTGSPRAVTGTLRARIWDRPPPEIVEELSLQRMPPVRIAYLERLMVRPTLRGRLLIPSFFWRGYEHLMAEGVDAFVYTAVPGLARYYIGMGARTYGAQLVDGASSAEVPLVVLTSDYEYLRRVRSFMAPQVRRLRRPFDPALFQPLFDGPQPVSFDPEAILAELAAARPPMLEGLPPTALRWIARGAFVLEVAAGGLVVRKGTAEREMYVVLSGALDVNEGAARIGPGEAVGEMAFLGTPGLRTATVRALQTSRLLVLRRGFLDELARRDPRAAYALTRNLARTAADRFAELRGRLG